MLKSCLYLYTYFFYYICNFLLFLYLLNKKKEKKNYAYNHIVGIPTMGAKWEDSKNQT